MPSIPIRGFDPAASGLFLFAQQLVYRPIAIAAITLATRMSGWHSRPHTSLDFLGFAMFAIGIAIDGF